MVKLLRLNTEDELTKFYMYNCMKDTFLRFLFDRCNNRLIAFVDSYVESGSFYDFGVFMECRCIFINYLLYNYNLDLGSIELTDYFFKLNDLDIRDYIDLD